MRLAALAWRYLWSRPLVAALNLALLALGLASVTFVLLASEQIEQSMERDLAGIDLVVGAKGSPLQLILAGVFHIDVPTGNIPLAAVDTLRKHPMIERVVPISLGDTLKGFRIVGTSPDYLSLYGLQVSAGQAWQAPMQAVLGADVARSLALKVGDRFMGSHGLGQAGEVHAHSPYTVVGIAARSGTVADRLVLTSSESVWAVHDKATAGDGPLDDETRAALAEDREVTMLLVSYRTPLAAVTLPRWVNAQPALQSAAPAFETARLMTMLGAGAEVLRGFGAVLLLAAGMSVFIGLYHAVREREPDLAMMRMLGAPPRRVAAVVLAEALWLALLGTALGLALGHGVVEALGMYLRSERSLSLSGAWLSPWEAAVPLLAVALAVIGAALPAWRAFRLDVTRLLQSH